MALANSAGTAGGTIMPIGRRRRPLSMHLDSSRRTSVSRFVLYISPAIGRADWTSTSPSGIVIHLLVFLYPPSQTSTLPRHYRPRLSVTSTTHPPCDHRVILDPFLSLLVTQSLRIRTTESGYQHTALLIETDPDHTLLRSFRFHRTIIPPPITQRVGSAMHRRHVARGVAFRSSKRSLSRSPFPRRSYWTTPRLDTRRRNSLSVLSPSPRVPLASPRPTSRSARSC